MDDLYEIFKLKKLLKEAKVLGQFRSQEAAEAAFRKAHVRWDSTEKEFNKIIFKKGRKPVASFDTSSSTGLIL